MNIEKKINEIFKDLAEAPTGGIKSDFTIGKLKETHTDLFMRIIAGHLVSLGYRKPINGNWRIAKIGDGGTTRTCSNCHISQTVNVYNNKVMFKYCPYCGAKMEE